jgi:hypothetical protein
VRHRGLLVDEVTVDAVEAEPEAPDLDGPLEADPDGLSEVTEPVEAPRRFLANVFGTMESCLGDLDHICVLLPGGDLHIMRFSPERRRLSSWGCRFRHTRRHDDHRISGHRMTRCNVH